MPSSTSTRDQHRSTSTTPPRRDPPGPSERTTDAATPTPDFRALSWRLGNALVTMSARLGVGPIALLTTTGRRTGRPHTVPVVPIDHDGHRWLVAPYGPVGWVHNVRAHPRVTVRHGRRRDRWRAREVGPQQAAAVLRRYLAVASGARRHLDVDLDAPTAAFEAAARDHPVFQLRAADHGGATAAPRAGRRRTPRRTWPVEPPVTRLTRARLAASPAGAGWLS